MKFGARPRKVWKTSSDFKNKFNRLNSFFNRLMILETLWPRVVGDKEKFWKLESVKGSSLHVSVRLSVARSELIGRRAGLIRELNKHFDKPWIEKIEIDTNLGASHE